MQDAPNNPPKFVGVSKPVSGEVVAKETAALTDNIARLETSLDTEKEQRLEERFRWICSTAVLIDIIAVVAMNGSWAFLPIFMLQLIVMIGFAKAYGVDWAEQLIGQLLYTVSKKWASKDDE